MATRTAYAGTAASNDVLTAASVNKLPGGWVGYSTSTTSQSGITSTTDVNGATATLTLVSGRRYKVCCELSWTNNTADAGMTLRLKDDGTDFTIRRAQVSQANDDEFIRVSGFIDGDGASHTVKASADVAGGGSVSINADATRPNLFWIEDVGPTS